MIVVDTSALVAIAINEADGPIFARTIRSQPSILAPGTLVELHAVLSRRMSSDSIAALFSTLACRVETTDEREAQAAADAYRRYGRGCGHPAKLNLGDTFSYAAAKVRNLPLLFKGDDFSKTDVRIATLLGQHPEIDL